MNRNTDHIDDWRMVLLFLPSPVHSSSRWFKDDVLFRTFTRCYQHFRRCCCTITGDATFSYLSTFPTQQNRTSSESVGWWPKQLVSNNLGLFSKRQHLLVTLTLHAELVLTERGFSSEHEYSKISSNWSNVAPSLSETKKLTVQTDVSILTQRNGVVYLSEYYL